MNGLSVDVFVLDPRLQKSVSGEVVLKNSELPSMGICGEVAWIREN